MTTTNIVFLLLPHLHLLDLAGPDQVFYEAIDHGADVQLHYCSFTDDVETSTHLPFGEIQPFHNISFRPGDYLMVPGADMGYLLSGEFITQIALFGWLRQAHFDGAYICSICTGAFVLAQAGLLNGRTCTTHWKRTAQLQQLFPKAQVTDNILFTEEDRIFTSAGVTAGIDMALFILSRLKDDLFSYNVARELVVYVRRQGSQAQQSVYLQYRNHIHAGIHKVQDWLHENLAQKANLSDLADLACMSTRNLTRTFRKETGVSVNDFVTLLRQERIHELLKNRDITRLQIARQVGLKSERQVARLLLQK